MLDGPQIFDILSLGYGPYLIILSSTKRAEIISNHFSVFQQLEFSLLYFLQRRTNPPIILSGSLL